MSLLPPPISLSQRPFPASALTSPDVVRHVLNKVAAGFTSPAIDSTDEPLNIHAFLIRRPLATFIFGVAGNCLTKIGILDGDYLVVDRSIKERDGHLIVASIDGEFTAKRLRLPAGRPVELHPENDAYAPILLQEGQELRVFGVVIGSFRGPYPL